MSSNLKISNAITNHSISTVVHQQQSKHVTVYRKTIPQLTKTVSSPSAECVRKRGTLP